MPKQRLPWFKIWVGATRHEKVVTLNDHAFRAWVELLDAASEQPVRGHFTSYATAAAIIRRPVALVRCLRAARLLDERADGVWLHDWPDWQRWQSEEQPSNGNGLTHESHTNDSGSHGDQLANAHESHSNGASPRVERAKREKREGDVEGDVRRRRKTLLSATQTSPPPQMTDAELAVVGNVYDALSDFGFGLETGLWRKVFDQYGTLDLEQEAFKQADWLRRKRVRSCSASRYTNWLANAAKDAASREPVAAESTCTCAEVRANLAINRNSYSNCDVHGRVSP